MSLVIHYWIWDVQYSQGVSASEMTYIVSSGALNSTHLLTYPLPENQWWCTALKKGKEVDLYTNTKR